MKIVKDVILATTRFLVFKERHYIGKNDKSGIWNMVSRVNGTRAVVIVAFKECNLKEGRKIVVNKEFRVPIADWEYGFPAGLIDEGESVEEAVRRELKEETGLDVVRFVEISPFVDSSAGMTDESIALAFVEVNGTISDNGHEASENIITRLLGCSDVEKLLHNDYKFDAKAWIILNRFARSGEVI